MIIGMGLVAACSDEQREPVAVSHDEIAETMRKVANSGEFFRAGQWESTSSILDISGLPESEAAELKARIGGQKFSTCLTPEEVEQPDSDFFSGNQSDCSYSRFAMADGKIEAAMRCVTGNIVQENQLTGTYSPERYDFTLASQGQGPAGETMTLAISAQRVGDCARLAPARPIEPTGEKIDETDD